MDSEDSVSNLRQTMNWLSALPGVRLQGEQWFPIKLNNIKKESVFEISGAVKDDFIGTFREENRCA